MHNLQAHARATVRTTGERCCCCVQSCKACTLLVVTAVTLNIGSIDAITIAGSPRICAAVATHTQTGSTASFEPCMHNRETDMTTQYHVQQPEGSKADTSDQS
jgi:hypothetical protein